MITVYPHDSGIAWISYLIDHGRFEEVPRVHILEHEHAKVTICGTQVGRHWIWGEDPAFEPTPEILANFESGDFNCKRCLRALRKRVNALQGEHGGS
jgi:hypothetical protein